MTKFAIALFILSMQFVFSQAKKNNAVPPPKLGERNYAVAEVSDDNQVDVIAKFPGGVNKFRQQLSENMDFENIVGDGVFKTDIIFDISTDGKIENIKTSGANDSFNKAIVLSLEMIKEIWTPAELKGKKVKYKYRMPVTMMFK